jgi:hypothetical protein
MEIEKRAFNNEEYNRVYQEDVRDGTNHMAYGGREHVDENYPWYDVSDLIPMTENDVFELQKGLGGVYNHWAPGDMPTHWMVRRGPYEIKPEWDYMDVLAVNSDNTRYYDSFVCRDTSKNHTISRRRFDNLVARLSDPDHDIRKIKKSYF